MDDRILEVLSQYCDEFLVHGVDVEGKASGVETELVKMLGRFAKIPVTYAGGIGSMEDLRLFEEISGKAVDFTIGSPSLSLNSCVFPLNSSSESSCIFGSKDSI